MRNVYVSISTAVIKLTIDDDMYEDAAANALNDVENTIEGIKRLLSMLCVYTLAVFDFNATGHPESREIRNKINDLGVVVAIAALWRYNQSVTGERDALLVVDYDKSRRGAVKQFSYGQFNGSGEPYMSIVFGQGGSRQEFPNLQPRVYVRIGTTVQSPVIGVRLLEGRETSIAATIIDGIADTEDAIEKYMVMLGQYASALYYCYVARDKDAEQLIQSMRTDELMLSALLLERYVHNRRPESFPVLAVSPLDRTKATIGGFAIHILPKPPIPPELQVSFTLGDPESRVLN